ncbi:MAG: CAP domain-containing protein [Hyphomicrobiales bacterium]
MAEPSRRHLLNYIVLAGLVPTTLALTGCVGTGIDLGASEKGKPDGLDPAQGRIITTSNHISRGASLTSAYRRRHGQSAVTPNAKLQRLAERHALVMAKTGKVQHAIGFGDSFVLRLHASGYVAQEAAENISGGFDTIEQAMVGWQESPGHRKNMLKPAVREIGLGVSSNPTTGLKTYWVMVLGVQVQV